MANRTGSPNKPRVPAKSPEPRRIDARSGRAVKNQPVDALRAKATVERALDNVNTRIRGSGTRPYVGRSPATVMMSGSESESESDTLVETSSSSDSLVETSSSGVSSRTASLNETSPSSSSKLEKTSTTSRTSASGPAEPRRAIARTLSDDQKWSNFQQQVCAGGIPPPHHQKQAILALQKQLDPNLKIPLIVTGVAFAPDGNLAAVSVVTKAETDAIIRQYKKLDITERNIDSGKLQSLAAQSKAKTKSIPMQGKPADLKAGWRNTRIGKEASRNGGTAAGFIKTLNATVRGALMTLNNELTKQADRLLDTVSLTLDWNDMLATEGLFRLSPRQMVLEGAVFGVADASAASKGLLKANDSDAAIMLATLVKTAFKERSDKFLSCKDVRELNEQVEKLGDSPGQQKDVTAMLKGLPQGEFAKWSKLITLCKKVADAQAAIGPRAMKPEALAIVIWPGLVSSSDPTDAGPMKLIEHLIRNASVYFPLEKNHTDLKNDKPRRNGTSGTALGKQAPSKDWAPTLQALADVRDAFAYLPQRFGDKYDANSVPMRNVFQKGFVRDHIDVPNGFEKSYKEGKFLELFGALVRRTPTASRQQHIDLIDVPLLRACDELREKMKGRFSDEAKVALLNALATGDRETAREFINKNLRPGERQHVHAFFAGLNGIVSTIHENTSEEGKAHLTVDGMASNFYYAVCAFLGVTSNELAAIIPKDAAHQSKAAAKNLVMNCDAIFGNETAASAAPRRASKQRG